MKILVRFGTIVLVAAFCSTNLTAAARPDSLVSEPNSAGAAERELGYGERDFAGGFSGILLEPRAAFAVAGSRDLGPRSQPRLIPVPVPPASLGRSAGWLFAGAIAAAFVSFSIILLSTSGNE